jgi:hypothetical protein
MKKIILGIFVCVCLCGAGFARAAPSIIINEVLYDVKDLSDTDHEWVELYNTGATSVSLVGWKFTDSSSHTLNAPPANGGQGTLSIEPGGYAILTGNASVYLSDHPNYTGTVIDTVMSLNNSSGTLTMVNSSGTVIDTMIYSSSMGASGDGNTLSRNDNGLFVPTIPTPGYQNQFTSTESDTAEPVDDSGSADTQDSSVVASGPPSSPITASKSGVVKVKSVPYEVKIITPSKFTVGVPALFSSKATGNSGEELFTGNFLWSFGDGGSIIRQDKNEFSYTYAYPGEYVLYLEYYRYPGQTKPEATARKILKVLASSMLITAVSSDGSIEISNTGNQEVDLLGWRLDQKELAYVFPAHLIVLPKAKIIIPPSISKFSDSSTETLLIDPSGISMEKAKTVIAEKKNTSIKTLTPTSRTSIPVTETVSVTSSIPNSDGHAKETKKQASGNAYLIYIGLGAMVFTILLSILFLRTGNRKTALLENERAESSA